MKATILTFLSIILYHSMYAQEDTTTMMESNGKIGVVIATIAAIFIGIVIFLIILERQMSRLERQIKS